MPKLAGRPLLIGGNGNRGVVASASPEASYYGIKPGMPTQLALMMCPDAVVLKGDFDLFTKYSNIVDEVIAETAPLYERAAIDEFYLDMSGMERFFGSFRFTEQLLKRILKETGIGLSFGLSVNKTVAKMCTSHAPPNNGLAVKALEVQPFLDPQPIKAIPSLHQKMYQLLRRLGIRVIATLRQVPPESMQELFGDNGISVWEKAHGVDASPVVPYSQEEAISKEKTFGRETQDLYKLEALLLGMVEQVAFELRQRNMMCSIVSVKIRYANQDTEVAQKKVSFTADDELLIGVARGLFKRLYQRRMLLRLVGVKLSGLVRGSQQATLFTDNTKAIRLHQAMDGLKHRYNDPKIVMRAASLLNIKK